MHIFGERKEDGRTAKKKRTRREGKFGKRKGGGGKGADYVTCVLIHISLAGVDSGDRLADSLIREDSGCFFYLILVAPYC